ncbi:hypothetical protein [Nonomuraea rubra]|uniref:hypothetical protein n=1 Tax=Nonomuraea rubra TaxID=46180 RepID=UPI0031F082AA
MVSSARPAQSTEEPLTDTGSPDSGSSRGAAGASAGARARPRPGRGVDLLPRVQAAGQQLGDPLLQHRDPGVARADGAGGAAQRLVDALRVVADQ